MSLIVVFFITYVVVLLATTLITMAAHYPGKGNPFRTLKDVAPVNAVVTFIMVTLTMGVSFGLVYAWGNTHYPTHCHSCGELITEDYYAVDMWKWHPDCFIENSAHFYPGIVEYPREQPPAEQEAPSGPAVVNSSPGVENTVERISGTVGGAQVKFNQGE